MASARHPREPRTAPSRRPRSRSRVRRRVDLPGQPHPEAAVEPSIAAEAVDILKGVVSSGTGAGANIGRPQFGKTGTAQNASDAWFVGAVPQLATAVWVGFPRARSRCAAARPDLDGLRRDLAGVDLARVHARGDGGDARAEFGEAPDAEYVTRGSTPTRGCLANPYTLPQDVDVLQFPEGTEPQYEVCSSRARTRSSRSPR